jgi:hypothetical protein
MDPLHITEFGSDRYLEKIQQESQANATPTPGPPSEIPQGRFILPIRGYNSSESNDVAGKSVDAKRSEKKSFLSFRSKFHAKGPSVTSSSEQTDRRPSLAESATRQR